MKKFAVLILATMLLSCTLSGQESRLTLNSGWVFRHSVDTDWYPAKVPGCVHLDQMAANIIPDPYFGENEKNLQWIEEQDWVYKTTFVISEIQLLSPEVELVFEGLDTYATVSLNQVNLAETQNMFRTWRFPVKNLLKPGINTLEVTFHSAVKKGKALASQIPFQLPGDEKVFTRKAAYQYGWDWGPRLVTCGIWRPAYLSFINGPVFRDVFIRQDRITPRSAEVTVRGTLLCPAEGKYLLHIMGASQYRFTLDTLLTLNKGSNSFSIPLRIEHPRLWHIQNNSHTPQPLTSFHLELKKGRDVVCFTDQATGLRSIELVNEKDSVGSSFYFRLNGKAVFMRGANYIPPDNFMSRPDSAYYSKMIQDAVASNINMLRIWGGGVYESDYFYDLCDEYGILVWQDFMFACAMYPGDTAFLNNVKAEATDNIKRLRNHPCIALWCGNNEIDEGWHNWGWQKQYKYSARDSAAIWQNYLFLFENLLPETLHSLDPGRPYWPSSPSIGWGHRESLSNGDSHYWGVWWGMEPFETYEKKVPRFMSEFGFQGFPDINTVNAFTKAEDRVLGSSVLKAHQKHPTGFETIQTYMEREFKIPSSFEDYIYASQVLQAEGIRRAIEAQRRAKPRCMGSLYWQFNDCWPVISWSGRDWYGRWKPLQYAVKQAFEPLLVSVFRDSLGITTVHLMNDRDFSVEGTLNIKLLDSLGKLVSTKIYRNLTLPAGNNITFIFNEKLYENTISLTTDKNYIINAEFTSYGSEKPATAYYFSGKQKEVQHQEGLSMSVSQITGQASRQQISCSIHLKAVKVVRNIWLQAKAQDATFSNNYFTLLPGEEITVDCTLPDQNKPIDVNTFIIHSIP